MPAFAPVTVGVAVMLVSPSPLGAVEIVVLPRESVNVPGSLLTTSMVPLVALDRLVPEIVSVPALELLNEQALDTVPENRMFPEAARAGTDKKDRKIMAMYFIFVARLDAQNSRLNLIGPRLCRAG